MTEKPSTPDSPVRNSEPASLDDTSGVAALTEDLALAQLKDPELSGDAIELISRNAPAMKSRKVRIGLVGHPRTPRRIALRVIRELFTFELMQFALMPTAPADLKRVTDELLLGRLTSITFGERISLARRCSSTVAGGLLLDKEAKVWQAALENPRLTELSLVKALQRTGATAAFVEAVCHHPRWSPRLEIRVALLRNPHTPVTHAIEFARRIPPKQLRDILHASRLPEKVKAMLLKNSNVVSEQWPIIESRQSSVRFDSSAPANCKDRPGDVRCRRRE